MNQVTSRKVAVVFAVLTLALWPGVMAQGQGKGPPVPEEMKVLARRIGTWTAVVRAKQAEWTPEAFEAKSDEKVEVVLQGWAIQGKVTNLTDGSESMWLESYDIHKKAYRFWYFSSRGDIAEGGGKWDPKTKTMTSMHMPQPGVTAVHHWRLVGDDVIEWDMVAKDPSGKVYLDMAGKLTRKR